MLCERGFFCDWGGRAMSDVVPPSEFVRWIQWPPISSPSTARLTWTSVIESSPNFASLYPLGCSILVRRPPVGAGGGSPSGEPGEFCAETVW